MKRRIICLNLVLFMFLLPLFSGWAEKAVMRITVDNVLKALFINGEEMQLGPGAGDWTLADEIEFEKKAGKNVIAAHCTDAGVIAGLLADISFDDTVLVTDETWKFNTDEVNGWEEPDFDDTDWGNAVIYEQYPQGIWGRRVNGMNDPLSEAFWIWSDTNVQDGQIDTPVFFRFRFGKELSVSSIGKLTTIWGKIKSER